MCSQSVSVSGESRFWEVVVAGIMGPRMMTGPRWYVSPMEGMLPASPGSGMVPVFFSLMSVPFRCVSSERTPCADALS